MLPDASGELLEAVPASAGRCPILFRNESGQFVPTCGSSNVRFSGWP